MNWDLSSKHTHLWCIGIAALTFIVYVWSLSNAFVGFDDGLLIYGNPLVQRMSPYTLWRIFTSYDPELYIPFTLFLYQIQYLIAGPAPTVFHFTNLLLHITNALLVVWVISMMFRKRWMGVAAGLLFAVHPMHTETVAWASATKDLLSALFFLLSIGFYLRFLASARRRDLRYSIGLFALGLLSKVVILLLPFVLLLLDHFKGRGINRRTIAEKRSYFVLMIAFIGIALVGKSGNPNILNLFETAIISCKSTVFYLHKFLLPTELSVLYPQETAITLTSPEFFIAAILVMALIALFVWSYKHIPRLSLGIGLFLLPLVPNFVNFSKNGYLFFASDRYAYLPSIGLLIILLLLTDKWITTRRKAQIGTVAGLVVVLLFSVSARTQSLKWKNSELLYLNILEHFPKSTMALNNLGGILQKQGEHEEAFVLFTQAFEIDQGSTSAISIGLMLQRRGEIAYAQEWYETAVEGIPEDRMLTSTDLISYYFLADLREKMGFTDDALALYEKAAERGNTFAEPHINLGIAYQKRGRLDEASETFRTAIRLDPNLPTPHYHLAGILAETGSLPEAEQELIKVLRIDPHYENAERHLRSIQGFAPMR